MDSTKENTIDKDIIIKNYENMLRNIFIPNRTESENCRRLNVTSIDTQIRFCVDETWPDGDLVEISNMSYKASMLFDFDSGVNQVYIWSQCTL